MNPKTSPALSPETQAHLDRTNKALEFIGRHDETVIAKNLSVEVSKIQAWKRLKRIKSENLGLIEEIQKVMEPSSDEPELPSGDVVNPESNITGAPIVQIPLPDKKKAAVLGAKLDKEMSAAPTGTEQEESSERGDPMNLEAGGLDDGVIVVGCPWEGRKTMICFPSTRPINLATFLSFAGIWDRSRMYIAALRRTVISSARNELAETFLKSDAEWSLWMDDDMVLPFGNDRMWLDICRPPRNFNPQAAKVTAPFRLHATATKLGAKIVSGLYYGRGTAGKAMFPEAMESNEVDRHSRLAAGTDFVRPVQWPAMGCCMVHRSVFAAVRDKLESEGDHGKIHGFFDHGQSMGEDKAFGLRAKAAGFQSYIDHAVVCGHVGQMVFLHHNTGLIPDHQQR